MDDYVRSFLLMFTLLNPFMLSIYLLDLIDDLKTAAFSRVLARAALISGAAFGFFAWSGDAIFSRYLQVRFASFQVFGGIVFLLIGIRLVFEGAHTIRRLRGDVEHLSGSIAMPFMIGPGTISASIVIGARHSLVGALTTLAVSVAATVLSVIGMKILHDRLKERYAKLTDRYVEIVGRVSALVVGTFSVEMILDGVTTWLRAAHILGVS